MASKNVLITGSNGQLGKEIESLSKKSDSIFSFFFTDVAELDITNSVQVANFVKQNDIKYIINCAAYTNVDKAETEPEMADLINVTGAENLAQASASCNCYLIHISTDYVFDGNSAIPYTEGMPTNPRSAYGISKLKGEIAVQNYDENAIIIRTSWLYSEFGGNFVKTMLRLMKEKESLNVIDDQKGTPTYAADLANLILYILSFSEKNKWVSGVYHFSNLGEATWFGFAEKIKELAKIDTCALYPIATAEYSGSTVNRPMYSVMDKTKIERTFQYQIPNWENGLQRCLKRLGYQLLVK